MSLIKHSSFLIFVILLTTCKKDAAEKRENLSPAQLPSTGSTPNTPGNTPGSPSTPDAPATPSDDPLVQIQKDCGINLADLADPNKTLFQARYRSIPITISGTVFIINYTVVVQAVLEILSKNTGGTQSVKVSVLSASPSLAQSKAESAAEQATSSSQSVGVSQKEMSKISATNKQFEGLLCAVTATKESTSSSSGTLSYEPGLPATISPFASVAQQQKEIGQGRDFDVVVNVKSSAKGLAAGSKISGRVSIRPVAPQLVIPYNGQNIVVRAKGAYMVQNMFQDEKTTIALGMPLRTVFYTDGDAKKFLAIVADTGQEMQGTRLPLTVFLPDSN